MANDDIEENTMIGPDMIGIIDLHPPSIVNGLASNLVKSFQLVIQAIPIAC